MIPWVGLASGIGGNHPGCGEGPLFLKERLSPNFYCKAMILPNKRIKEISQSIAFSNRKLAQLSSCFAKNDSFFVSIGGDHSCAIGVWSGVASALRPKGDLGLIWFDAHMDAHTPSTSETGNIHGMPLAALLGHGDALFTHISDPLPKIKPENLVLIGIRSFESGEAEFLNALNVRIYFMEEVIARGLEIVMKEALKIVSSRTVGYGFSFDLDSIDPSFISAVGTPVPGGINGSELLSCLSLLQEFPPLAFEMVEYNPSLDSDFGTLRFILKLLESIESAKFSVV